MTTFPTFPSEPRTSRSEGRTITHPDAFDRIVQQVLYTMYAHSSEKNPTLRAIDEERNAKIRAAFQVNGWENKLDQHRHIFPAILLGEPGQRKSHIFVEVAKEVAALIGMNVLINPSSSTSITQADFVLIFQDFAQIPLFSEAGPMDAQREPLMKRWSDLRQAGGALLLLDDINNESPLQANVALTLFEKSVDEHIYIGGTGRSARGIPATLASRSMIVTLEKPSMNLASRVPSLSDLALNEPPHEISPAHNSLADGVPKPRSR